MTGRHGRGDVSPTDPDQAGPIDHDDPSDRTADSSRRTSDSESERAKRRSRYERSPGASIGFGRLALSVLAFAAVFYFLVFPMFADFDETWETLRSIDPWLGLVAIGLQALMWFLNGQSIRLLLVPRDRPTRGVCFGSAVAAEGISHVIPVGAAGTAIINYKLLRQAGAPSDELVYALSASGVVSVLVLNVMLAISIAFAIPQAGANLPYPIAIGLGVALAIVVGAALWALLKRTSQTSALTRRLVGWIPGVNGSSVENGVREFAGQVNELVADPRLLGRLIVISALRWVVGATVAWVVFEAIGNSPNVFGLFVAFALANVMAMIPVSPGGLGLYEATMIAAMIAFGSTRAVATAGVLAFRAINFWLPIPLGAATYLGVDLWTKRGHGLAASASS